MINNFIFFKKLVDINGNEVWTTETTNADGTKVVLTEKVG